MIADAALGGGGGWLAERHGWAYAFEAFDLVGVVCAFVLVALLRDAPRDAKVDVNKIFYFASAALLVGAVLLFFVKPKLPAQT